MRPGRFQRTLRHVCRVHGRGYWTGRPVCLTFQPASQDTGIVFRRVDLPGRPSIPATAQHRIDMPLRTGLGTDDAEVEMVEHVLAALYSQRIDNCLVDCDAVEMPGLDGSASEYCLAIRQAGSVAQPAPRRQITIEQPVRLGCDQHWILALPSALPGLLIEYVLEFDQPGAIPGGCYRMALEPDRFDQELAAARTFISRSQAEALQQRGLARHVTYRDLLVFDEHGPVDNQLRFPDECVRHKLLDVVGDLALCGCDLQGRIIAHRSGHSLNGSMAEWLSCQHGPAPSRLAELGAA